jgi:hypothetical protein
MTSSVPRAGRSPFSYLARSRPKVEGQVEDDDTVIDEGEDDEDEDETDDEETKKKKKAKKKAEDKEDEEDDKKSDAHAARARERARVHAIMSSRAGQQFPTVALSVATGTSIPRHQAIRILRAMTKDLSPGAGGDSLRDRMAALNQPDIGAGDARPAPNLVEMVVAAYNKTLGKT